jgi:cytochrome bd-type quinol oxidase subunit 1
MNSGDRLKALIAVWFSFSLIMAVALVTDRRISSEELFLATLIAGIVLVATVAMTDEQFVARFGRRLGDTISRNGIVQQKASLNGEHPNSPRR